MNALFQFPACVGARLPWHPRVIWAVRWIANPPPVVSYGWSLGLWRRICFNWIACKFHLDVWAARLRLRLHAGYCDPRASDQAAFWKGVLAGQVRAYFIALPYGDAVATRNPKPHPRSG